VKLVIARRFHFTFAEIRDWSSETGETRGISGNKFSLDWNSCS